MNARLRSALGPPLAALVAGGLALAAGAPPAAVLAAAVLAAAMAAWLGAAGSPARGGAGRARPARAPAAGGADAPQPLLDALPVGVLVIAGDGTIRLANRSAAETFGLPGGLASGRHPAAVLRAPRLLEQIEAVRRGGEAGAVDFPLPRGDAQLRAHVRPAGGGEVVVAVEDRTDASRASELHRDFVANASHELKTPLAAVWASIETLQGHAREDPAATERFLGVMAGQVRRMTRLVEDLLSLNRIELNERVAPREPQDLAAIVAEAVEALRPAAEEAGAVLEFDAPEDAPAVRGDRNELGQVFRNLVENAVKYGGPGVEVRVGILGLAGLPDGEPGMVGVAIRDTGPGISREHLPRLTERFYRVSVRRSRETGGTGLGLAIVKHVVARHRGRLEIASRPGEGACFTVWLPLAQPTGQGSGAAERTSA